MRRAGRVLWRLPRLATPGGWLLEELNDMARAYTTVSLQPPDGGCEVGSIERALRRVPGVTRACVNPVTEMAYVEYDPAQCDERRLRHAVADATGGNPGPVCVGPARSDGRDAGRRGAPYPALPLGASAAVLAAFVGVGAALFPYRSALSRAWEMLVVGVDAASAAALPVGIAESFVAGWVAGWLGRWALQLLGAARRAGHARGHVNPG